MLEYNSIAPLFCNDLVSGVTVPSRAKSSGVSHLDHCIDFDSRPTSGPFWRDETIANFFAGARGGQNQRQLFENMFLGDKTTAIFFVRVPAEQRAQGFSRCSASVGKTVF